MFTKECRHHWPRRHSFDSTHRAFEMHDFNESKASEDLRDNDGVLIERKGFTAQVGLSGFVT